MAVTRVYKVAGMTCDHCKQTVAQAAKGLPGVTDVQVDLEAGKLSVTFANAVRDEDVQAAVAESGYQVVG